MNILRIAWRDISSIFRNRLLRVSVAAIIVVPLMYSFFYLYAFWDPYSKLDRLPVAVVNLDRGGVNQEKEINYGSDIVKDLKRNHSVGWRFVSKDEALKGLKGDKYYAMIVIPEDFTKDILSAKDGKPRKATIVYTDNEKKNFLAAQINSKVVLELKDEIAKRITDEYTRVTFDNLYDLKDGLQKAAKGSEDLNKGLMQANNGSQALSDGAKDLKDASVNISTGIGRLYEGSYQLNQGLKTAYQNIAGMSSQLDQYRQLASLLSPENLSASRSLIYDASFLKDADTSALKLLPSILTPQNINAFNRIWSDYAVASNSIKNLPVKSLQEALSVNNLQSTSKLMQDASDLAYVDMTGLQPILAVAKNADAIQLLLDEAQKLSNVDAEGIAQWVTQQQQQAQKYIQAASELNTPQNVEALKNAVATNDKLDSAQKAQLLKLVDGYYNLTKSTEDAMVKSREAMSGVGKNLQTLEEMQKYIQGSKGTIDSIKSALSPGNVEYLSAVMQKLMAIQQELKQNQKTLVSIKNTLEILSDPSSQQALASVSKLMNDVSKAQVAISAIQQKFTPQMMDQIARSPEQINQLIKMQNDLKSSGQVLELIQGALSGDNIAMARKLIGAMPSLENGMKQLYSGSDRLNDGLKELNDNMPSFVSGASRLYDGSSSLNSGLLALSKGSEELSRKLGDGARQLRDNLKSSSKDMASFVSQPLAISNRPMNKVKNYGVGFTPYFIPLSLWVGAIMMFFIITDEVDPDIKASSASLVLGKLLSYGYIGIMQAVLVSIIVMILGLRPVNIPLFFAFNVFMSFVYIAIIQSLVFLLGQAGKLISIVLLILQLTSDAGTFPIELVPTFFKVINPYMPFTYAVSGLREIISGVDYAVLAHDAVIMVLFFFAFLIISIMMKERMDKIKSKLNAI
ncbi:YhgE/Pip domain-containing protein [Caldanaerobius polysaccharolyticus]|uniref:YhgE/Pip domain-containing protein n=1 Tax=Caldanaerobius polysaccharolyticus TaxID=44256 RepID=UPI000478D51A|nr:YhgE/Pip domain-containing protein [Caldanaerobius polysaccharolyticus]